MWSVWMAGLLACSEKSADQDSQSPAQESGLEDSRAENDSAPPSDSGAADSEQGGGDSEQSGGDSEAGTGHSFPVTAEGFASMAILLSQSPSLYMMAADLVVGLATGDCPSVTYSEDYLSVSVTGDCSDDQGQTWTGSMEVVGTQEGKDYHKIATYSGFSVIDSVGGGFFMEGSMEARYLFEEGSFFPTWTENRADTLELGLYEASRMVWLLYYQDYEASGDLGALLVDGTPGVLEVSGELELVGAGTLGFEGQLDSAGSCDQELSDGGSLRLEGSEAITVEFDGLKSCEGCVPWVSDRGDVGEVCGFWG